MTTENQKHTPGPWRYEYEPGYCGELIAPDGMTIAAFDDEPRPNDARLIAAAPELLEALRRIVEWDVAGMALTEDHISQANFAIAKATGAQHDN